MATWSEDFQKFVDASHDDYFLQIRDVVFGANIVSFNLVFIGMIRWLVQLRDAGKLSGKLSVLSDTTFNLEWQGYTWGNTGMAIFRKRAGCLLYTSDAADE